MSAGIPDLPVRLGIESLVTGISLMRRDRALRSMIVRGALLGSLVLLVILGLLVWGVWSLTGMWMDGGWAEVVGWIARVALLAVAILLSPALYSVATSIVMPFIRSRIFFRARELAGAPAAEESRFRDEARFLIVELRRLGRLLLFTIVLLPLHLIPVVGSLAHVAATAIMAGRTYAWDLLGYHFELHRLSYPEQKAWLRRNQRAVVALGLVATLLLFIPVAQFAFAHTNVAAAGTLSAALDRLAGDSTRSAP